MTRPRSPWTPATRRRVPRPPAWLLGLGWALAGLGWLADAWPPRLLALGVFAALTLWWAGWLAQGSRP